MMSSPAPHLSIIIPVFNQWTFTQACLETIRRNTEPHIPYEVIVVDNASTDETTSGLAQFQAAWPALQVERLPTNTGFSPACNRGAELARGEFLVFLNNDTEPQVGWLTPLLRELEKPGIGIVAPKLLYPSSGTINHAGYVFGYNKFYGIYHELPGDHLPANEARTYQALLGACVVLRRDVFRAVGGFSLEGLEDIDLCLKIGARGMVARYIPSSVVHHHGSVTLRLSPPGSYPVTDVCGFAQRWGPHTITWDDYWWYLGDGAWPFPPGATEVGTARAIAQESTRLIREGERAAAAHDLQTAKNLLRRAGEVWPHNPWAFTRCAALLQSHGTRADVFRWLERLEEFSFFPILFLELEEVLREVLPPEACAAIFDQTSSR